MSQELAHRRFVYEQPAWAKNTRNFLKGRPGIGNVITRAEIDHEVDVLIRQRERVNVCMK